MKPSTNALFAALLATATATMMLAACSQVRSGVVEAPMMLVDGSAGVVASAAPSVVDASDGHRELLNAGDHFEGNYICNQGSTSLDLAIDAVESASAGKLAIEAVFTFDYQGQTTGAFRLNGTFDPRTRALKLDPQEWIDEGPNGWVMVGLSGTLGRTGMTLAGLIDGPGCTKFSTVRKQPAEN